MTRMLLFVTLLLAVPLPACGEEASADKPPDIEYGTDTCSRCHMIISDERFAAAITEEGEDPLLFDDLGEMIMTIQEEGLGDRRAWVHDYESREWLDATDAFYVDAHDIITPMATAIVAFAQRERANAFAAEQDGRVLDWPTVLEEWKMRAHPH